MGSFKDKYLRYRNLFANINNWPGYLFGKAFGFKGSYTFQVKDFGAIDVPREMHAPFKENFIDEIYFRHIPSGVLQENKSINILDIGANAGFFSLAAFKRFPEATIYAFEPHPYCFKVLEAYKNAYAQYDWQLEHVAASNASGTLTLNTIGVDRFTTMSNVVGKEKQETFTVPSVSLDDFLKEKALEQIDFVKLDCEGAEYDILYTLSRKRLHTIKALCVEAHLGTKEKENVNDLSSFLKTEGFSIQIVEHKKGKPGYIWAWRA